MKVRVKVKQHHIVGADAMCNDPEVPVKAAGCPVTIALAEIGYDATVWGNRVVVDGFGAATLPFRVEKWLNSWVKDSNDVNPFSFTVDIP